MEDRFSDVKEWYDGYHFGAVDVYCPWDVINQCDKLRVKKDAVMEPHWENSSSNAIVQDILSEATETTKAEIEVLISGGYVEKQLLPELTYTDFDSEDIDTRQTYLWSALFSSGYLTDQGETDGGYYRLVIPNREVLGIYEKKIRSWIAESRRKVDCKIQCGIGDRLHGYQDYNSGREDRVCYRTKICGRRGI